MKEFATLKLGVLRSEGLGLSALDWHRKGIGYLMKEYGEMRPNLMRLMELSRYGSIPLCNINQESGEMLNFVTDVLYQRLLKQVFNSLSWYGSGLKRDNRELIPTDFSASTFTSPGYYMSYSVEIDIQHLSLNTILLSDELKNVDRETSALIGETKTKQEVTSLDELVGGKLAFRVLKTLVAGWLEDVQLKNDVISD